MHDLEYAVGIGCWLAVIYLFMVYKFGNLSPFIATVAPIITISAIYIVIILVNALVKIILGILRLMFSPEVIMFIVTILLMGIFAFMFRGTMNIIYDVPLEVD